MREPGIHMRDQLRMSWVTLDRFCQEGAAKDEPLRRRLEADNRPLRSSAAKLTDGELLDKLRGMGFELDRSGVGNLCAGALSAEEVARPLHRDWEARNPGGGFHVDWIWICLLALWERWWPDKVCLELLDDKIQAGYDRQEQRDLATCAATWLDAWADVLRLCDATGIGSIDEFDDRFPLTQSLYNWLSDVEMELWNAGVNSREFLTARIGLCSEALRRFPGEEQWRIENLRRALRPRSAISCRKLPGMPAIISILSCRCLDLGVAGVRAALGDRVPDHAGKQPGRHRLPTRYYGLQGWILRACWAGPTG